MANQWNNIITSSIIYHLLEVWKHKKVTVGPINARKKGNWVNVGQDIII